MDPELETKSNEIVQASAPAQKPVAEKPKKSKGLIATATIMTILALAGIAFGVYGMFFYQKPDCGADCPESDISKTETENTAPSVADVKQLLESKYGYQEIRKSWKFEKGIGRGFWDNLDSMNDAVKLAFTIKASENLLSEADWASVEVKRTADYDAMNERYKYYFGSENNIPKEETSIENLGIIKTNYLPDTNTLEVVFANGLGGYSSISELSKIDEVVGTKEKFTAKLITIDIDSVVKQDATTLPNKMGDGIKEEYYIEMTEETIKEAQESLSAYKLNFVSEDGEYKLISIVKD